MQDLLERRSTGDEITISIHFSSGERFDQPMPIDCADGVQEFMDWFRHPKGCKVYTFYSISNQQVHMFHHNQIIAVDIDGYIEPEGRKSRWYVLLLDRLRSKLMNWRIKA